VTSPFETVILKLKDLGMFQFFFPFMLSAAIFYGLLRKSKIFGDPKENTAINAVVALVASLMVWASPIIAGINIETQLAAFFTQAMVASLVVMIGLLIASFILPPNLPDILKGVLAGKYLIGLLVAVILAVFGILISSGLITAFFPQGFGAGGINISDETILTIGILILMGTTVAILVIGGK
jgi:hypothetical protein